MTGLEATWRTRRRPDGLSAFDPTRDLKAVVDLLHLGFGAEMADRDKQWLSELSALANAGPLLTLLAVVLPHALQGLSGFVWYEDGELVANASLMRGRGDTWVVANVVTRPEFRRRGLAGELMNAITARAIELGARQLQLQVRDDNEAARRMYERLGYKARGARSLLRAEGCRWAPDDEIPLPDGVCAGDVVSWGADDRNEVRRLLRRAGGSSGGGPPGQLRQAIGRVGWRGTMQDIMHGRKTLRWAVRGRNGLLGLGAARLTAGSGPHQVELATDPDGREAVARVLVSMTKAVLSRQADAPVEVDVDARERATIDELLLAGFDRCRTLELMVRNLT